MCTFSLFKFSVIGNELDSCRVALLAGKSGGALFLARDFDRRDNSRDELVFGYIWSALAMATTRGMRVLTISELLNHSR